MFYNMFTNKNEQYSKLKNKSNITWLYNLPIGKYCQI